MKSADEVEKARTAVRRAGLLAPGLSDQQKAVLSGMSVALQWVAGDGGSTLQRMVDGEPVTPYGRPVQPPPWGGDRGNS